MFTKIDDTHYKLIGEKKDNIFPVLEPKVYTMDVQESFFGTSFIFSPMERYENSKVAQVGIFKDVYEYTKGFFNESRINLRKEMGFVNKMNLILKGDPGTGKTHLACTVASELVKEHNGVGIVVNSIRGIRFDELIDKIRINDGDERLLVFVLDELEKNGSSRLSDTDFLAFLDGAKSRENVIIIATVNSISQFPNFLIKRPGRFEKIYDFVFNTEEVIKELTTTLIPERYKEDEKVIEELTSRALLSNVKTVDHLRFMILDYLVAYENGEAIEPIVKKDKKKKKKDKEKAEVVEKYTIDEDSVGKKTESSLLDTLANAVMPN